MRYSASECSQAFQLLALERVKLRALGLRNITIYLQHALDSVRVFDELKARGDYHFASVASMMPQFAFPRAGCSHLGANLVPRLRESGRQQRVVDASDRF